ncbi:hypothetical protein QQ045_024970 [Rhodiola kirilowii]
MGSSVCSAIVLGLVLMVTDVRSDMAKDRELCADQLIGLASCLPYVGGGAKAPTLECCSGLKTLQGKICLCLLVKDRDDPDLGLKINASLALNLPSSCHAPANVSECPGMLHLAPNSTEAKIFYEAGSKSSSSTNGSDTATPISSTSTSVARATSDGGRKSGNIINWNMASAAAFGWCFAAHVLLLNII